MSKRKFSLGRKILGRPAWQILAVLILAIFVISGGRPLERLAGQAAFVPASIVPTYTATDGVCSDRLENGWYVVPTYASLRCERSTILSTETSAPVVMSKGCGLTACSAQGWIECTEFTDKCDVYLKVQTDKPFFGDAVYDLSLCDSARRNCDEETRSVRIQSGQRILVRSISKGQTLSVQVRMDKTLLLIGSLNDARLWKDFASYSLIRYDFVGGGGISTVSAASCVIPSDFRDPQTNMLVSADDKSTTMPDFIAPTSTQAFNYVSLWVPIAPIPTKTPLVTYNNQQAFCLGNQVYTIGKFESQAGCFRHPDRVIGTVACCPGQETPTAVCGTDFAYHQRNSTNAQCTSDVECQPLWTPDYARDKIFSGSCNRQTNTCQYEYKNAACLSNSDCNGGYCQINQYTGDTQCKSAGTVDDLPDNNAEFDWVFWLFIILIIIVALVVVGVVVL